MALGIGAIASGVGALTSVFGGGGSAARREAAGYKNTALERLRDAQRTRDTYGGFADRSNAAYNRFDPQSQDAIQQYADYLNTDSYNQGRYAMILGEAVQGAEDAYRTGTANALANAARTGNTNSNVYQGTVNALESDRANAMGGAKINLALQRVRDLQDRMRERTDLLSDAASNYRGDALQGYGLYDNANNSLIGSYLDLSRQAQARADAASQRQAGAFGTLADLGTGLLSSGRSAGGYKLPTNPGIAAEILTQQPSRIPAPVPRQVRY